MPFTHDAGRCDSVVDLVDQDTHQKPPAVDHAGHCTKIIRYGWRFWIIFAGLALSALLSGLEGSIVATALPTILGDLGAGDDYVWVINIYFLTSAACQPLYGQLADLWGRRWLMISSVAIFTTAGAISGTAQSTAMLLVGRGIQGVGAGGINMLVDLIICDLVPLRDRGSKMGILFALMTIASAIGPLIGGALAEHGAWRWIFYLNLPIGTSALILLFVFLRVSHKPSLTPREQLSHIDFIGNGILIASTTLIQYALTYAGSRYAWNNPHITVPLATGLFLLLLLFTLFERSPRLCPHPVIPPHVAGNRTSAAAFFITFNHAVLAVWITYFFPLYFQAVLGATPQRSGVQLLPLVFVFPAVAAGVGVLIARTGRFRPAHFGGLAMLGVGVGCCSLLGGGGGGGGDAGEGSSSSSSSSDAPWIVLQMLVAAGLGAVMPALLPAVQAELRDADAAASTAAWAFVRSLGTVWGVAIPAAVFNNRFRELLDERVGIEPGVRAALRSGSAYEHATKAFVESFRDEETRTQVVGLYADSLKRMWQIGVVFAGISFLAVFFERPVLLRKDLETEFGLERSEKGLQTAEVLSSQEEA